MKSGSWRLSAAVFAGFLLAGCQGPHNIGGTASAPDTNLGQYRVLYDKYLGAHSSLIANLFRRPSPNFYGGAIDAGNCIIDLRGMQALLQEPHRTSIEEVIAHYTKAQGLLKRKRPVGSETRVSQWEHLVRRDFVFTKVAVIDTAPAAPAAPAPSAPAPSPTPAPVPAPVTRAPDPPPPVTPAPSGDTPLWVYFEAWEGLHKRLQEQWTTGEDCRKTYDRLIKTLEQYLAALPNERRTKMHTYLDSYEATRQVTTGFTKVPPSSTKEDILNDLKALGSAVRLYYRP